MAEDISAKTDHTLNPLHVRLLLAIDDFRRGTDGLVDAEGEGDDGGDGQDDEHFVLKGDPHELEQALGLALRELVGTVGGDALFFGGALFTAPLVAQAGLGGRVQALHDAVDTTERFQILGRFGVEQIVQRGGLDFERAHGLRRRVWDLLSGIEGGFFAFWGLIRVCDFSLAPEEECAENALLVGFGGRVVLRLVLPCC